MSIVVSLQRNPERVVVRRGPGGSAIISRFPALLLASRKDDYFAALTRRHMGASRTRDTSPEAINNCASEASRHLVSSVRNRLRTSAGTAERRHEQCYGSGLPSPNLSVIDSFSSSSTDWFRHSREGRPRSAHEQPGLQCRLVYLLAGDQFQYPKRRTIVALTRRASVSRVQEGHASTLRDNLHRGFLFDPCLCRSSSKPI